MRGEVWQADVGFDEICYGEYWAIDVGLRRNVCPSRVSVWGGLAHLGRF